MAITNQEALNINISITICFKAACPIITLGIASNRTKMKYGTTITRNVCFNLDIKLTL